MEIHTLVRRREIKDSDMELNSYTPPFIISDGEWGEMSGGARRYPTYLAYRNERRGWAVAWDRKKKMWVTNDYQRWRIHAAF